jgi:putative transposase
MGTGAEQASESKLKRLPPFPLLGAEETILRRRSSPDLSCLPNLAKDVAPTGLNQLWVSDITFIALPSRFIYVAVVLNASSRLIVGYAIGPSIDARLTVAALRAAVA